MRGLETFYKIALCESALCEFTLCEETLYIWTDLLHKHMMDPAEIVFLIPSYENINVYFLQPFILISSLYLGTQLSKLNKRVYPNKNV